MKALYWIIGAVVVIGGAWLVLGMPTSLGLSGWGEADPSKNTQDSGMMNENMQPTAVATGDAGEFRGSMQDLMSRSGSWQCAVSMNAGGVVSNGTTYVSGGKVRADFTSNVPQFGNIESHMIARDNTVYTWTSMMNKGFKMPMQSGEASASTQQDAQAAAMFNDDYSYNCQVWAADESKFALPSGITF